jgi:hypothetical protein
MWGSRSVVRVYVDASGQIWHDVPGYGRVTWSIGQITEHALLTKRLHRPGSPIATVGLVWRVVPAPVLARRKCRACLGNWICREARWARWWLDSTEHGWRHVVESQQ